MDVTYSILHLSKRSVTRPRLPENLHGGMNRAASVMLPALEFKELSRRKTCSFAHRPLADASLCPAES
jgi:hypothetical protein